MPVTTANIEGAASLIIWTIAAIVMVKYAVIVLRADDNGQGAPGGCAQVRIRARVFIPESNLDLCPSTPIFPFPRQIVPECEMGLKSFQGQI